MSLPQFLYPYIGGFLDCFPILATVNNDAVNRGAYIFFSQCFHFLN